MIKIIVKINLFFLLLILSFGSQASNLNAIQQYTELANNYELAYFDHFPEMGLLFGKKEIAHDRFMDHSAEAIKAWQDQEDTFLFSLNTLNAEQLKGTSLHNSYLILKETLENSIGARICNESLWAVNAMFGWHNVLAMVAERQPVNSDDNRTKALTRWRTFGKVVDDEMMNLKLGLRLGYSAPKSAVMRVINQLKIMRDVPVIDSPFYVFAKKDTDLTFKARIASNIISTINPSLDRIIHFLEHEYLPQARSEIGVSVLPHGKACYQAKIKQETTLAITPEEIHQIGLAHMQKLILEVEAVGKTEFGLTDEVKIYTTAKNNSTHVFRTEQDILNYNREALQKVKLNLLDWFDLMPLAEGIIQPYPEHRAKTGAAGEYLAPSEDGSKPGIFYINTYNPASRSRIDMEATLFHELIPGHHFQVGLAYEDKSRLSLDKFLYNSGFVEGWALYVERLADEMGVYRDNISRIGMLSNEALRTSRLILDTGIHTMNWSREQAVQYLKKHTALDDYIIESEVDRYIMMPGQATAYMLGKYEIQHLRELAQQTLGDHFDIRVFHNQVLQHGSISLPMLNTYIKDWLEK